MDGLGVLVGILVLCWFLSGRCATAGVARPVFSVSQSAESLKKLERTVAPLMAMSEDELIALVPHRTGFRYVACAGCSTGVRERQLDWSINDPFRVRCRHCATVYPGREFVENRTLRRLNPLGDEVEYPFYEDGSGRRYFFRARAWWCARFYLADCARDLGQLYQLTGQRKFARRSALILDVFARYYPGFLVWVDVANSAKRVCMKPPFPRRGGKWGDWRYAEIPTELIYAYDSIRASGELERLPEERGEDACSRIEDGFFRGGIRQDAFHGLLYTNASPETYEGYAVAGRVLGEPALVHRAVQCAHGLFRRFSTDGFWCQGSPGYHRYTLTGLLRVLDALAGYSDPSGYLDPEDGRRFDEMDPVREFADVERCRRVLERFRYPDGRPIPVHDSWARFEDRKPGVRSRSALFAGMGHAWLGLGRKNRQAQVHLHFSEGGHGHDHADMLNVMLYAFGEELLSDLGYTHTRYRMPVFLAWRQGRAPLSSVFAAVYEPFEGSPFIESVRQVYADDDSIAVEVRRDGIVDHIVHRTAWRAEPLVVGNLSLRGEFGFVWERDGDPAFMGLWGGDELRWKDEVVSCGGTCDLRVVGVLRKAHGDPLDGLEVTGETTGRTGFEGTTAIVRFGDGSTTGCVVRRVIPVSCGLTLETAQDPGFSIENGGTRHHCFPLRSISGPVSCRIRNSKFVCL